MAVTPYKTVLIITKIVSMLYSSISRVFRNVFKYSISFRTVLKGLIDDSKATLLYEFPELFNVHAGHRTAGAVGTGLLCT